MTADAIPPCRLKNEKQNSQSLILAPPVVLDNVFDFAKSNQKSLCKKHISGSAWPPPLFSFSINPPTKKYVFFNFFVHFSLKIELLYFKMYGYFLVLARLKIYLAT